MVVVVVVLVDLSAGVVQKALASAHWSDGSHSAPNDNFASVCYIDKQVLHHPLTLSFQA